MGSRCQTGRKPEPGGRSLTANARSAQFIVRGDMACYLSGARRHITRPLNAHGSLGIYSSDRLGIASLRSGPPLLQVGGGDATIVNVISALTSRPIA